MTQFFHFFTAVRSLGQERDLRYRGAQKFRGPAGPLQLSQLTKILRTTSHSKRQTNKQTNKFNFFLFRTCKPREICWLCHAVILFPSISKENMLDHKSKLSENNAFDTKLPSVPSNIFRIIWRISLRWQTEISSIAGERVLRILILSESTTSCWLFKKTTRNEGLVHCCIRLIQRYKDHQNGN